MSARMKSGGARGTVTAWFALGFFLLTAAGCARPDWIEQTLVTVDVTGVWRGDYTRGQGRGDIDLTLQQSGPKVTGQVKFSQGTGPGPSDGSLEGTVAGDLFRFHSPRGQVTGELQVNGDEMTGSGIGPYGPTRITLRRQQ